VVAHVRVSSSYSYWILNNTMLEHLGYILTCSDTVHIKEANGYKMNSNIRKGEGIYLCHSVTTPPQSLYSLVKNIFAVNNSHLFSSISLEKWHWSHNDTCHAEMVAKKVRAEQPAKYTNDKLNRSTHDTFRICMLVT